MAEAIALAVEARDRAGKGAARATRRAGRVPAIVYGDKRPPRMVSLDPRELERHLKRTGFFSRVYEVSVDGEGERVLAREVQLHPVSDQPLHVDFLRVTADTVVNVEVEVVFEGEEACPGLRRGGVLNIVRHAVELSCSALAIPSVITASLEGLDIGDSIHISHVELPQGVRPTVTDRDFTIATIAAPTVVVEEGEGEEDEEDLAAVAGDEAPGAGEGGETET